MPSRGTEDSRRGIGAGTFYPATYIPGYIDKFNGAPKFRYPQGGSTVTKGWYQFMYHTAYDIMYWDKTVDANLGFGWNTWWPREMEYFNHWLKLRQVPKRVHFQKFFDLTKNGTGKDNNPEEASYAGNHPKAVLTEPRFKDDIKDDLQPGLHQDWESQKDIAKPRGALLATVAAANLPGWNNPEINHYIGIDGYTNYLDSSGKPGLEYTDTSYEHQQVTNILTFGPHWMDVHTFFTTDLDAVNPVGTTGGGSYTSDRTVVY